MKLGDLSGRIPKELETVLTKEGIDELRPSQDKAVAAGLLDGKNLLVCTPTASGKTLIAEFIAIKTIVEQKKKAIYIVPLVALANEKFKEFSRKWGHLCKIVLSVGDLDRREPNLAGADFIVCTAEKLDSLFRHSVPWISQVGVVIVDEIHLLNDASRGPTLEILITLLRTLKKDIQIIGLSATIGNPDELASWLGANLVMDFWRPVQLKQGVFSEGKIDFKKK